MNSTFERNTHTPGSWVPTKASGLRWTIKTTGDKGTLAYMTARPFSYSGNFSHGQIEANARLIAAAPDLLVACEAALNDRMFKDWPEIATLLKNAIAKAKGEQQSD